MGEDVTLDHIIPLALGGPETFENTQAAHERCNKQKADTVSGLRILVCGGREYNDRARLFAALTAVHRRVRIAEIIHGAARGADTLAGLWARSCGVPFRRFPVDHCLDGPWPGAGYRRNQRMYRESKPDMVLAFPGGKGTGHMVKIAREWNCSVYEAP